MSVQSYKIQIDGLRAVAIFMVLIEHFAFFIGEKLSAGYYGVNLFFVISGYLITSILLKTSQQFKGAYLNFLGRRFLRIFPIYYLTVFLLYVAGSNGIQNDIIYLLTYTYNYRLANTGDWEPIYRSFWSLSVEEQFYIFFPVLVLLLRKHLKFLIVVCLLILVLALGQLLFNFILDSKYNYVGLLTNMYPLCLGATGAIVTKSRKTLPAILQLKWIEALLLICLVALLLSDNWKLRFSLLPFLNLLFVLKAANNFITISAVSNFLQNKATVFIGRVSYGLYVYHLIVGAVFSTYVFDPLWKQIDFNKLGVLSRIEYNAWIIKFPLLTSLSIFVAYLSFRFFEQPILKLKDRYFSYK